MTFFDIISKTFLGQHCCKVLPNDLFMWNDVFFTNFPISVFTRILEPHDIDQYCARFIKCKICLEWESIMLYCCIRHAEYWNNFKYFGFISVWFSLFYDDFAYCYLIVYTSFENRNVLMRIDLYKAGSIIDRYLLRHFKRT